MAWFAALSDRLKRVIVLNRDWRSAVTPSLLVDTPTGPGEAATRCVLLDPPYRTDRRKATLYSSDADGTSDDAAVASYAWALKHGDRYRIAYCCHADDFPIPDGWEAMTRGFKGRRTGASGTVDMVMFSSGVRAAASETLVTGYNRTAWTEFIGADQSAVPVREVEDFQPQVVKLARSSTAGGRTTRTTAADRPLGSRT